VPGASIAAGPRRTLYLPVLGDLPRRPDTTVALPRLPGSQTVVVRTSVPPGSVVPAVRRIVRELDPKVPIARVRTLDEVVAGASARARLTAVLLAAAAGTALLLGIIGIYGVVSYAVSLRTSEFGIRLALGATPARVQRLVLGQGALVAVAGTGLGVAAALALTRLLRGLLYEISPVDPVAFVAMPVLLLLVALLASYLPARRAARIDPARAMRAE
jgi:cell division protein FtsX